MSACFARHDARRCESPFPGQSRVKLVRSYAKIEKSRLLAQRRLFSNTFGIYLKMFYPCAGLSKGTGSEEPEPNSVRL